MTEWQTADQHNRRRKKGKRNDDSFRKSEEVGGQGKMKRVPEENRPSKGGGKRRSVHEQIVMRWEVEIQNRTT